MRSMQRQHGNRMAALALLLAAVLLPAHVKATSRNAVSRRSALEEQIADAVARLVPSGYAKAGHRDSGISRTHSGGGHLGHETVMFTAGGDIYTKRLEDTSHLPRRLSELGHAGRGLLQSSSAQLNPDLSCDSCPTTDVRVPVNDTTVTPWDSIGLLARQDANSISNGIAQCSGALIGVQRQHVLTAGHCLVDSSSSTDNVDKITFYPGLDGSNTLPFGTLAAVKARVLRQYVEERSFSPLALNYDFALITLSNAAPKGTTYLDIEAGQGRQTFDLTTAGYPADKPGNNMWAVNCSNVKFDFTNGADQLGCGSQCSNIVVHDCLSYEGQSGSAIWSTDGNNRTIRAVLTGALSESDGTTYNVATQLNSFVYNTIVGWYNEDVKGGLTLAPPAPPASSSGGSGRLTTTLGNQSWWRSHWWYVVVPVAIVVVLLLGSSLLACMRGCCGLCGGKRTRPLIGAAYPPAYGAGYPNQQPYPQNGTYPQPNYYGGEANGNGYYNSSGAANGTPVNPDSNYARYGPAYYNGTGSSGSPFAGTEQPPTGYPQTR